MLAVGRHFISENNKVAFEETLRKNMHYLEEFATPGNLVGGWRVEKEPEGRDEWVHFTGWKDVAEHIAFSKTESFQKYAQIKPLVDDFDIKHAIALKLE